MTNAQKIISNRENALSMLPTPSQAPSPTINLITFKYCGNCFERSKLVLRICARCRLRYYCSVECQREEYPQHKEFCKQHKVLSDAMEHLRSDSYFAPDSIGHFWGRLETRQYCRARYALAEHILREAHLRDHQLVYEAGLAHCMELMRLSHSDNMGVRFNVPFILLALNRDSDAYNFLKWWMTVANCAGHMFMYDRGDVPQNTSEGDWLYLQNQDRFEDLLTVDNNNDEHEYLDLNFLSALTLIKMRILCEYELFAAQMERLRPMLQQQTPSLHENNIVAHAIQSYLVGNGDRQHIPRVIETQSNHLNQYLSIMFRNNPVFVRSVINPGALRDQFDGNLPMYTSRGSNEEAFSVMDRCLMLYATIPGGYQKIEEIINL